MSEQSLFVESKGKPASITSATFTVSEADLLKIRATVIDIGDAANERAVVCTIRFFDEHGNLIEQPYEGVSLSAVYGSYVYVASNRDGEVAPWIKEVIVAPIGACLLKVALYPWKTTPDVKVVDNIQCLDIRRIPTDEISWNLHAGETQSETYEVLPFWRSLFSFDVLRKTPVTQDGIKITIRFFEHDGDPVNLKTAAFSPIIGTAEATEINILTVTPVSQKCEYDGYDRLTAFVQVTPPAAAIRAVVTVVNEDDVYSVRISQRIFAFDTLIESRFAAGSCYLIAQSAKLPGDLAQLSFAKLTEKRPDDLSVYDVALEFYLASDNLRKIIETANNILNRFQDGGLCAKARNALALVTETMPSWRPTVASTGPCREMASKNASGLTVGHFLRTIENGEGTGPGWDLVCAQKALMGNNPFVILPLGYPEKGENGLPWEQRDHEDIACYYLNCLSLEQLKAIPVTSQLNFMTVLASDIFVREGAELIHVQEGERGYDFALVGLALSRALRVPLVYQKFSQFEAAKWASSSHETLSQSRAMREYYCMLDADAVIVSSEIQRTSLVNDGITADKVFVWPAADAEGVIRDMDIYHVKIAELCRRAYAYALRVSQRKYTQ